MAPKRTMRSTPATTTTPTTTSVTNAQLKALIDQGVVDALAARDANRSMNGDDSHNSGNGFEIATELMDKKIRTFVERQTESKRKFEDTPRNNQNKQQPNKRQNTGKAYVVGSGEKKPYGGSKPLCPKCNYHRDGRCAPKCHK
ncbi:hypothetical protein Tco_0737116 [Tanacetum coccineum]